MLKNDFPKFCLTEGKNPTTENDDKKVLDLVLLNIGEKQHFLIIFLFFCKDSRKVLESDCSFGERLMIIDHMQRDQSHNYLCIVLSAWFRNRANINGRLTLRIFHMFRPFRLRDIWLEVTSIYRSALFSS